MNSIDKTIFRFLASHAPNAIAKIRGGEQFPKISGTVEFYSLKNGLMIVADIDDLPKTETNIFAFHVHEGNSCGDNFSGTGGHYNPKSVGHPMHAGDMPPLFSNDGSAWQAFFTDRMRLDEILGRTVIIHDHPDDFVSQPSGNSGEKIACGVIEKN